MNTKQYLQALKKLGLPTAGKRTGMALGMTVSGLLKISSGAVNVSRPMERLLAMYLAHGLPEAYELTEENAIQHGWEA